MAAISRYPAEGNKVDETLAIGTEAPAVDRHFTTRHRSTFLSFSTWFADRSGFSAPVERRCPRLPSEKQDGMAIQAESGPSQARSSGAHTRRRVPSEASRLASIVRCRSRRPTTA
jgi:hypothetical protein